MRLKSLEFFYRLSGREIESYGIRIGCINDDQNY